MRQGPCLVLCLLLSSFCWSADKPQRIASLSLCTDQLLLMLVDKQRIVAITDLAPDPLYSYHWQAAQGINIHSGLAEEIVPLQPDLIISSTYSTGNTLQMLRHLQQPVIAFDSPTTLLGAEQFTRDIGAAVGEPERAEQIIKTMHQELARAQSLVANKPKLLAISYAPNGFTAGKNTLKNEILEAAGYRNLAAELGISYYGNLSVEQLLHSKPDVVIVDEDLPNQNSLAQLFTAHPALTRLLGERGPTRIPSSYWLCPGPLASKAVLALAEQRQ